MATALEQYIAIDTIIRDVLHANVCLCQAVDVEWEWYSLFEKQLAEAGVNPNVVIEALETMCRQNGSDLHKADVLLRRVRKGEKAPGRPCIPTRKFLSAVAQVLESK